MNPVPGANALAVLKEFKITYTLRYERIVRESTIEGATRHANNIARLYPVDAFRVLSIHDLTMHPEEATSKTIALKGPT